MDVKLVANLGLKRAIAVEILEMFETVLYRNGIQVPDDDRTGDETEACLFGQTYAELEDSIYELLGDYCIND